MSKKQYMVIGLGHFGMSVAKTISDNGYEVLGIDCDANKVQEASEFLTHAIKMDINDEGALKDAGMSNFDVVIIAVGSSLEASIIAALTAKELGIGYIVAKAKSLIHKKALLKIGVDRVILPEKEMGVRVANSLIFGNFVELIEISEDYGIAEIEPLKEWIGKKLLETDIRSKYGFNVVAVKRNDELEAAPAADTIFEKGDILLVLGQVDRLQKFMKK